jgi:hypothetical protein
MPRSKSRKRDGRPVRMRPPAEARAAMVFQRQLVTLIEDLDRIVLEVPATYDPDRIEECVEHHFHCEAVVRFLRERDVAGVLARLAGGELVVMPDPLEAVAAADTLPQREPGAAVDDAGETVAQALDLTPDPMAGGLDNGLGPDVWVATRRRGIPYHAIDFRPCTCPDAWGDCQEDLWTTCGRSTSRGEIMPLAEARALSCQPCGRCYPALAALVA